MAREDDFDDDRPRRPRRSRDDDFDDRPPRGGPPAKSSAGMIVGIICGTLLLVCGGGFAVVFFGCRMAVNKAKETVDDIAKNMPKQVQNAGEAAETRGKLTVIGRGLTNYHDTMGGFPADTFDAAGKPLLSWRVHLLPYMEQENLYRRFKLDQPWDSPANRALLREMPGDYGTGAGRAKAGPEKTYFRTFSGPGAAFEPVRGGPPAGLNPPRGNPLNSFVDGTSSTILVFEAGDPIEWTRPDQLTWNGGQPMPAVGGVSLQNPYFHVLMADGVVKKAKRGIDPDAFRKLIDRRDANVIPFGWDEP